MFKLNRQEIENLLKSLGMEVTRQKLQELISIVDTDLCTLRQPPPRPLCATIPHAPRATTTTRAPLDIRRSSECWALARCVDHFLY